MTDHTAEKNAPVRAFLFALGDWLLDRITNPKGYYDDGEPFRPFAELRGRSGSASFRPLGPKGPNA